MLALDCVNQFISVVARALNLDLDPEGWTFIS